MSQKDVNIASLLSSDRSGLLKKLHAQLLTIGLKTKMPSNTSTLLFEAVDSKKARHGLAAFRAGRDAIFSFPVTYWSTNAADVSLALSIIDPCHFIDADGPFTSSQYSMRQVRVSQHTTTALQSVIDTLIASHVRRLSGQI